MAAARQDEASQSPGGRGLRCELCSQIYVRPKLLPCLHTFCLHCLEELVARDQGGEQAQPPDSFPCPAATCGSAIPIPPGGMQRLQDNVYINPDDLARARVRANRVMCSETGHEEEVLKYYCLICNKAICISCKLLVHDKHKGDDLHKVAERHKGELGELDARLGQTITGLRNTVDLQTRDIRAARKKADVLQEQVLTQHDTLVKTARELRDKLLHGLQDMVADIDQQLTERARRAAHTLDSMLELQQRVRHAIDNPRDAEVVAFHKEVHEGPGRRQHLNRIDADSRPRNTQRPFLHSHARSLTTSLQRDMVLYLGAPLKFTVPIVDPADVITPFYRCGGRDSLVREVHALHHTDDDRLHIAFGGSPPTYDQQTIVQLNEQGVSLQEYSLGRKVSFDKSYKMSAHAPKPEDGYDVLLANSTGHFLIKTSLTTRAAGKTTIESTIGRRPVSDEAESDRPIAFDINDASRPRGFDANATGQLFVVVNEVVAAARPEQRGGDGTTSRKATFGGSFRRKEPMDGQRGESGAVSARVSVYRRFLADPLSTYTPPSSFKHFFPTAVSFWNVDPALEQVLIADWANDCVHVTSLANGEFQFIRVFYSFGCGELIRPTALDVDGKGVVWVGCETGWVLRCQPLMADFSEEEGAQSLPFLVPINPSRASTMD